MFVKIFVKFKKTQVLYSLRSLDIQCLRCVCVQRSASAAARWKGRTRWTSGLWQRRTLTTGSHPCREFPLMRPPSARRPFASENASNTAMSSSTTSRGGHRPSGSGKRRRVFGSASEHPASVSAERCRLNPC